MMLKIYLGMCEMVAGQVQHKKFHWLKLSNTFFSDPKMKKLRRVTGGEIYTIIYLKLMLLTLNTRGVITYEGIEKTIEEEIALKLDEDDMNVKVLLSFLGTQGLIEQLDENSYLLPQAEAAIGSESESAERVRKHRELGKEKKALQCNERVTEGSEKVTLEKEIEIYIEEEEEEEEEIYLQFAKWIPLKSKIQNLDILANDLKTKIINGDAKTKQNFELFKKSLVKNKEGGVKEPTNKAFERLQNLKKVLNSLTANELLKRDETTDYPFLDNLTSNYVISNGGLRAIQYRVLDDNNEAYLLSQLGGAA